MSAAASPQPLARRIASETARFAATQGAAAVLAWGANVLLARLLHQRDFGVYDICTFWIGIGTVLGDGGLGATLLRRRGAVTRDEYRATLSALFAVGFAMAVALFLAAPSIGARNAMTLGEVRVLRAMSPLYLASALRVVPYLRLERELSFARIARIEFAASLVRHALAIGIALGGGGVWALALANLAGTVVQLALAYRAAPGWVGLGFSWRVFRPLFAYGSQVQALGVCAFFKDNISPALLGGALGPASVGVFDFGLKFIQLPVIAVNALARVQLPVYARLERDDATLFHALRGATRVALLLGVPLLGAMGLAAPWLVPALYGPQWSPAYPVIWGLLANMVGGLLGSPLFTLLQGQGRAGLAVVVFVAWTAVTWLLAIASLLALPGDLGAVAVAHSAVTVAVIIGLVAWAERHLGRSLRSSLLGPVVAGTAALALGGLAEFRGHGAVAHPLVAALLSVATYAVVLTALEGSRVLRELRAVWTSVRRRAISTAAATNDDLPRAA